MSQAENCTFDRPVAEDPAGYPHLGEIRSLTGIRGLAACWVVVYHFLRSEDFFSGGFRNILDHGYLAVDLFFVLSGFVIGLTASNAFETGINRGNYLYFISLRLARVWPLYAFITLFSAYLWYRGLVLVRPVTMSYPATVLVNLLAIQSWGITGSIIGPSWSISTEFAAYLLFPFLLIYGVAQGVRRALVVYLLAVMGLFLLVLVPERYSGIYGESGPLDIISPLSFGPILRCLFEFVMGLVAFRIHRKVLARAFAKSNLASCVLVVGLLLLLAFRNTDLIVVIIFSAFIVHLSSDCSWAARILSAKPIHWLGLISYSLYLVHVDVLACRGKTQAILEQLHLPHSWTLSFVTIFIFAVGTAALAHYVIERPGRSFLRPRLARIFV